MTDSRGGAWEPEPFCEDVSGGSPPVVRTPYSPKQFCEDVSGGSPPVERKQYLPEPFCEDVSGGSPPAWGGPHGRPGRQRFIKDFN